MFNWKDLEKLSTREVLDGLMNGKYPLQDNTTKGYYYLQPQKNKYGVEDENEMERINVASAQSPNPKWDKGDNIGVFEGAITKDFKDRIGELESKSSGGYEAFTSEGGSMGALGKYQFRKPALQDLGFVNQKGDWLGYQGINSKEDFLKNYQVQEDAANKYFNSNAKKLNSCNAGEYIDKNLSGVSGQTFPISAGGLLAASHRMGSKNVCNYIKNLDSNTSGAYSMNYGKLSPEDEDKFKAIETRLRLFAR